MSDESLNTGGNKFFSTAAVEEAQRTEDPSVESDDNDVADEESSEEVEATEADDNTEEGNLQEQLDAANKRADDAELDRRKAQSERDSLNYSLGSQIQAMNKRIQTIEQPAQTEDTNLHDGDLADIQTVREIVAQAISPSQTQQIVDEDTEVINQWVNTRPDAKEVGDYIREKGLDKSPDILHAPTNMAGRYGMAQAEMYKEKTTQLEAENAQLKKEFKQLRKGRKSAVPPTNFSNASRGKGAETSSAGKLSRYFK